MLTGGKSKEALDRLIDKPPIPGFGNDKEPKRSARSRKVPAENDAIEDSL